MTLAEEIVQTVDAPNYRGQRLRHRNLAAGGDVGFAVHLVGAHRRLERLFHLARGAAELDDSLALGDVLHRETLFREPSRYLLDVVLIHAEGIAKLFRRHPLMIVK